MKLIIDIPEYVYEHIREYYEKNDTVESTYSYIYYGIPILDDATNGNSVIKIFFNGIVRINSRKNVSIEFNKNWWNAPYQKGDKE